MAEYKHQPKSMTKYLYHNRSLEIKNCPLCNFKFTEKKIKLNRSVRGDIAYSCENCNKFSFIDHHNKNNNHVNFIGLSIDQYYISYSKASNGKIYFSENLKNKFHLVETFDKFNINELKFKSSYFNSYFPNPNFSHCESFKAMKEVVEFLSTINHEEYFKNMRLM